MCEARPGDRCACDTREKAEQAKAAVAEVHPGAPAVDPIAAVTTVVAATPPQGSHPVWKAGEDGKAVLHGAYETDGEAFEAFHALRAQGVQAMIRPAHEDAEEVSRLLADRARFNVVADERAGKGPNPRRTGERLTYGEMDDELRDAYALIGPNSYFAASDDEGDGAWGSYGREMTIGPDDEIRSAQEWVSGTHIAHLIEKTNGDTAEYVRSPGDPLGLPTVYEHSDGSLWVLDGNHTVFAARETGRPVRVIVMRQKDMPDVRAWHDEVNEDGDGYDDDY